MKIEFTSYEQKFNTFKNIYSYVFGVNYHLIDGVTATEYFFSLLQPKDVNAFIEVIENAIDTNKRKFTKRSTQAFIWRVRDEKSCKEIARAYHISEEQACGLFAWAKLGVMNPSCSKHFKPILKPYWEIIDKRLKELYPD